MGGDDILECTLACRLMPLFILGSDYCNLRTDIGSYDPRLTTNLDYENRLGPSHEWHQ